MPAAYLSSNPKQLAEECHILLDRYIEEANLASSESLPLKCDVRPTRKLYKNFDADCSIEFMFYIEVVMKIQTYHMLTLLSEFKYLISSLNGVIFPFQFDSLNI